MERLIKKMGDAQASKASGAGMSMWLKKTGNDAAAMVAPKEPESRAHPVSHHKKMEEKQSKSVGMSSWLKKSDAPARPAAPPRQPEAEPREGASSPVAQDAGAHASEGQDMGSPNARPAAGVLNVASPPGQAGEPIGSQECSSGKDAGREAAAEASQARAEAGPGSDEEGADKDTAAEEAGEAEPTSFGKYVQDVAEEEEEDDDDELPDVNTAAKHAEASGEEEGSDGEQEGDARAPKTQVKATDFDDEEEFFLAGGDIKEAKRRKDWDFAFYHAKSDDSDDEKGEGGADLDEEAKLSKTAAKEAARKLQKDTERLLRERRCIIPPAHVERRPLTSLVEKLAAKAAERAKMARLAAASAAHEEHPMAPPTAPHDQEAAAALPVGMDDGDEDDELDDDMIIVDAPGAAPAAEKEQPKAAPPAPAHAAPKPQPKAELPPSNPRLELKARLQKTVLTRSEHLGPLLEQTAHADQPRAAANPAEEQQERRAEGGSDELRAPPPDSQDQLAQMLSMMAEAEGGAPCGSESQGLVLRYEDDNTQAAFDEEDSHSPRPVEQPAQAPAAEAEQVQPAAAARKYGRRANLAMSDAKREEGMKKKNVFDSDDGYENDAESEGEESDGEEEAPLTAEAEEEVKAVLGKGGEVDDDDDDDDDEEGDGDDDDDEDEEEEEEEEEKPAEPVVPVKKSLADIQSIKKQSALRIGTLEAGYLRNEEKVLAFHDDAEVAEEDLGEGIDLMETDGEDNEEEQDEGSDAEREVAEGFIENAKYAGEDRDPSLLRDAQMRIMDEDDQKITDKIMDVIQGNMRRKRAAENEQDGWVPNARARKRAFNGDGTEMPEGIDGAVVGLMDDDDKEDEAAHNAAENARQRVERIKFLQARRAEEQEKELEEEEEVAAQPLVRKISTCAPLAAFARSLSNSGRSLSGGFGGMGGASATLGQRPFGRGGSLLGSSAMCGGGGGGLHAKAPVATSRNFVFQTSKSRSAEAAPSSAPPQDGGASTPAEPRAMQRSKSFAPMPMQRRKTQNPPMKRTTSMLLSTLDNI